MMIILRLRQNPTLLCVPVTVGASRSYTVRLLMLSGPMTRSLRDPSPPIPTPQLPFVPHRPLPNSLAGHPTGHLPSTWPELDAGAPGSLQQSPPRPRIT